MHRRGSRPVLHLDPKKKNQVIKVCLIMYVHSVSPACLRHTHKRSTCTAAAIFRGSSTDAEGHSRKNSPFEAQVHDPNTLRAVAVAAASRLRLAARRRESTGKNTPFSCHETTTESTLPTIDGIYRPFRTMQPTTRVPPH